MKPQRRKRRIIKPKYEKCPFCEEKKTPTYKDPEGLQEYLTSRAKIMSTAISGVCSRHQRALSMSIKRARHLGLLPFSEKV